MKHLLLCLLLCGPSAALAQSQLARSQLARSQFETTQFYKDASALQTTCPAFLTPYAAPRGKWHCYRTPFPADKVAAMFYKNMELPGQLERMSVTTAAPQEASQVLNIQDIYDLIADIKNPHTPKSLAVIVFSYEQQTYLLANSGN